ncbi:MAG: pilus assembly protein PilP [Bacteriovoracia bacterium]
MKKISFFIVLLIFNQAICFAEDVMSIENFLNLRDPFRKYVPKTDLAGDDKTPELQRYSTEDFQLVGIITGPKKIKALLTSPDGRMHIVTERARIGQRKGVVKRITPQTVSVEEKVLNLLGREERITTVLHFKEKN